MMSKKTLVIVAIVIVVLMILFFWPTSNRYLRKIGRDKDNA